MRVSGPPLLIESTHYDIAAAKYYSLVRETPVPLTRLFEIYVEERKFKFDDLNA